MKPIAQGAEAKLYDSEGEIIKHRFEKKYRYPALDLQLRKARTKREAKILEKLAAINFKAPKLLKSNDFDKISIEKIPGKLVKDIVNEKNYKKLMEDIGRKVAILHNNTIIHGDLTTSNMIYADEVYFIDFGLSFFSHKIEDKAVDLHLLKEALESKHYMIFKEAFSAAIKVYGKEAKDGDLIIKRLGEVEKRGRYKRKGP